MGNIKVMDDLLANKIAAGEVVERPLSVVKELVENSIDAKSTRVYITLKNSGIDYINVVDDGVGMDSEDALLCFSRHASSKLTSDEMLFKIATLGFRGEALSSIAAISNVEMQTCNGQESTYIEIEAGIVQNCAASSFRNGTSVTVTKLFYNTPARLKYIKNLYSESAKIIEYVSKCALANPNIIFKLMNDGKTIIETSGSGDYLKVIRDIYSMEVVKALHQVDFSNTEVNAKMLIAKPSFQRSNKNYINIFVNKRVINSTKITKLIIEEFKDYIPRNRYPFCILHIDIEPELIDVNIHPNKYEIKFSKEDELLELISLKVREFLTGQTHKVEIQKRDVEKMQQHQLNLEREEVKPIIENIPKLENYVAEYVDDELEDIFVSETVENDYEVEEVVTQKEKTVKLYSIIGQFHGTYILAQDDDELVLIDQHAAVERVNYEKNQKSFNQEVHSQYDLLVPLIISRSVDEAMLIRESISNITDLGIEISEFGNTDFIIRAVPSWVEMGSEDVIIDMIIDKLLNNEKIDLLHIKDESLELMSCKESLKANSRLSVIEMEHIIDQLMKCSNPYHCPHGRPIIVSLSINEVEKLFKRVM